MGQMLVITKYTPESYSKYFSVQNGEVVLIMLVKKNQDSTGVA